MIKRIATGVVFGAMVFAAVSALGWGLSAALFFAAAPIVASVFNLLVHQFMVASLLFCVVAGIAMFVPFERMGLSSASLGDLVKWIERSASGGEKK